MKVTISEMVIEDMSVADVVRLVSILKKYWKAEAVNPQLPQQNASAKQEGE